MKARLLSGLGILVVAACAALICFPDLRYKLWEPFTKEAYFEGRPASYWINAVKDDKTGDLRAHAAHVLGEIGEQVPEAVPALVGALKDPDYKVRNNALLSLSKIG